MGSGKKNSQNGWHPQDEDHRFVENRYIYEDEYEDYSEEAGYDERPAQPRRSRPAPRRATRSSSQPDGLPVERPYRRPDPVRSQRPRQIQPVPKRRVWPTLLIGCVLGVVLVVGVLALLVFLGINTVQNGGHLGGLPGLPQTKLYTKTEMQTVALSQLARIQICDTIGNVTLHVDPTATKATITALKTVKTTSEANAANLMQRITIAIQSPQATDCAQQAPTATPTIPMSTATPTALPGASTPSTDTTHALTVAVSLPQPLDNQVDLDIALPLTAIQSDHPSIALTIAAPTGNISVTGLSGTFNIHGGTGNIDVKQAILTDGSQLETSQGDIAFAGFLLLPDNAQTSARYLLRNETGTITVTLPESTHVTLDANTNIGTIKSDFPLALKNTGNGPDNYHGPLNGDAGTTPLATLVLDVSTGNVHIQKARQVTQ